MNFVISTDSEPSSTITFSQSRDGGEMFKTPKTRNFKDLSKRLFQAEASLMSDCRSNLINNTPILSHNIETSTDAEHSEFIDESGG